MKRGILLMNLGSPDSTDVKDVKRYLDEFLMDGKVIDYFFTCIDKLSARYKRKIKCRKRE